MVRVQYALEMVNDVPLHATRQSTQRTFKDSMNFVHVDEKWFYLIKDGTKFLDVHLEADSNETEITVLTTGWARQTQTRS